MAAAKTNKRTGRPSAWNEKTENAVSIMSKKGFTDKEMAAVLGVTEVTLNNWKKNKPDFFKSLRDWKASADANVEKSLYERALGWEDKEGKQYPPDTTSMIFWLKNRQPDKWRDKTDINHQGNVIIQAPEIKKRG